MRTRALSLGPEQDYPGDALAGIDFQRHWEVAAFKAGGENFKAPAQKVEIFWPGKPPLHGPRSPRPTRRA